MDSSVLYRCLALAKRPETGAPTHGAPRARHNGSMWDRFDVGGATW
jgi:hypothetical protein